MSLRRAFTTPSCGVDDIAIVNVEPGEIDTARGHLHGLLGQVTLKPKDGVLWAYPTLNAKGLAEASPLHIKVVAGARYENYMQIELEPFPLVAGQSRPEIVLSVQHQHNPRVKSRAISSRAKTIQRDMPIVHAQMRAPGEPPIDTQ